jgi:RND family efflux transporter MFP subunit
LFSEERQMRRTGWLLVLAGVAGAGMSGCSAQAEGAKAAAAGEEVRVQLAPVERKVVSPPIHAVGVSVAKDQATLAFKVGGVIAALRVHAGDRVKAGELLASLDTAEVDAQVQQARAAVEKAERDVKRAQALVEARALPTQHAEDAQTALRMARQNLTIARFNKAHARLVASADGRVVRRLAEPGMVVAAGTPILQLDRAGQGYVVRAGLVDRDVVRVALGDAAEVSLDAFPGRTFRAKVSELAVEPSPLSGIYDVELRLDAPPPHLLAGLVAKVEITPATGEALTLVPVEALVEGDGHRATVFTLGADGRATQVAVETAFLLGDEIAVRHGLEHVERVVTRGASFLTEGARAQEVAP